MSDQTLTDAEIETGGLARMEAERRRETAPTATRTAPTAPTDRPTADATATPTDPTRTAPIPTPTPKTRASEALARCVEPVDAEEFLADYWEQRPLAVPRAGGGSLRRSPLRRGRRAAGLLRRVAAPGLPPRQGGRADRACASTRATSTGGRSRSPASPTPTASRPRSSEGATIVLQALHQLAAARALLPRARGRARPAGPGELVLHAPPFAGLRRPPRHARRLRPPGRRREALARLRPAAGAAAQARSATRRRLASAGPDRARADASRRRHALPPARLAARRADLRDRLAAHHGRRQRPHLGRRVPRGARRVRGRRRVPPLGAGRRRGCRPTCSSAWPSRLDADEVAAARGRSSSNSRRPILDGQLEEVRDARVDHGSTRRSSAGRR